MNFAGAAVSRTVAEIHVGSDRIGRCNRDRDGGGRCGHKAGGNDLADNVCAEGQADEGIISSFIDGGRGRIVGDGGGANLAQRRFENAVVVVVEEDGDAGDADLGRLADAVAIDVPEFVAADFTACCGDNAARRPRCRQG